MYELPVIAYLSISFINWKRVWVPTICFKYFRKVTIIQEVLFELPFFLPLYIWERQSCHIVPNIVDWNSCRLTVNCLRMGLTSSFIFSNCHKEANYACILLLEIIGLQRDFRLTYHFLEPLGILVSLYLPWWVCWFWNISKRFKVLDITFKYPNTLGC